ncbi:MAG: translation initiation factor IF-2 associated domain-containing protein, partial [Alphaproteobacteria bacterium]
MSEITENDEKKTKQLRRPGRLELRTTVEAGEVRQSFSHGRSKAVTVEVRRKRTFTAGKGGRMTEVKASAAARAEAFEAKTVTAMDADAAEAEIAAGRRPAVLRTLTTEEREARARAFETARRVEHDERKKVAGEALTKAEEEARFLAEQEAAAQRAAQEEIARKETEEERRKEEEERRQAADAARRAADAKEAAKPAAEGAPAP